MAGLRKTTPDLPVPPISGWEAENRRVWWCEERGKRLDPHICAPPRISPCQASWAQLEGVLPYRHKGLFGFFKVSLLITKGEQVKQTRTNWVKWLQNIKGNNLSSMPGRGPARMDKENRVPTLCFKPQMVGLQPHQGLRTPKGASVCRCSGPLPDPEEACLHCPTGQGCPSGQLATLSPLTACCTLTHWWLGPFDGLSTRGKAEVPDTQGRSVSLALPPEPSTGCVAQSSGCSEQSNKQVSGNQCQEVQAHRRL